MSISDKLTQIANNVPLVYGAGYDEGYEKGKAEGGDSYYDTFWDNFQDNGARKNYGFVFITSGGKYSGGWNDETFDPKHGFEMTYCAGMFQYSNITKLASKLKLKELKFDTSQCPSLSQMFQGANVLDVPVIDASKSTNNKYFLGSSPKTVSVEKFISSAITTYDTSTFDGATALKHIIFDGVIAQSITIKDSPLLDGESVQSLIDTLMTITDGVARTITVHQTVRNKLTPAQENEIKIKKWTMVPATKT